MQGAYSPTTGVKLRFIPSTTDHMRDVLGEDLNSPIQWLTETSSTWTCSIKDATHPQLKTKKDLMDAVEVLCSMLWVQHLLLCLQSLVLQVNAAAH
jgi:hypothetical protein